MTHFAAMSESNWKKTISVFSLGKMFNITGWKLGISIGPNNLVEQAFFAHEAMNFVVNTPGQIACARAMDTVFNTPYEGHKNWLDYLCKTFQDGREACIEMLNKATKINFKSTHIESGYFLAVDVTDAKDKIP